MGATNTDVAIIGAGITGLAIAWHLAERGATVRVFDGSGIGSGATAIQPGGVRQQWATDVMCRMAQEAYGFYTEIGERLSPRVDPGFSACGYLFLAHTPEELAQQAARVRRQNELGIPSRMVEPEAASELANGLVASQIVGAAWCEQDGYFDRPQGVVAAFADACRRAAVTFVDEHVASLAPAGGGWKLVLRNGESAAAASVIVANGYDSPGLLTSLGIDLPIEREPRYLFYSDPIRERLLEPLVISSARHFAAKQLADGSVLASDLTAGSLPGQGKADWHRNVRAAITDLVPILEYVSFPVLVEGFYDLTPDHQPILGRLDGFDQLWIAAGLNGRGLMMAPAIGRMLSEAVLTGVVDDTLAMLRPGRFPEGALLDEAQVV